MRVAGDHKPAILKTAARLFGQKRFHEVLMEDVADGAGIAKGTIYRYYKTKEALYADICLESMNALTRELHAVAGKPGSARQRLDGMLRRMARHLRQHLDFFQVVQREWSTARLSNRAAFLACRNGVLKAVTRVVNEGQRAGEFRRIDAVNAADLLMGMIRSMVLFGDPKLKPEEVSRMVLDVFLHGVSNPNGRERQ